MPTYDRKRRIERLDTLYKALVNEETDIIAEFEQGYGQPDNWDENTTLGFNNLHTQLERVMNELWNLKEGVRQGFL